MPTRHTAEFLQAAPVRDIRAVEQFEAPELMTSAQKQQIEYQAGAVRPARKAKQVRPITWMQKAAKLLVVAVNPDLSKYSAGSVCGQKRGPHQVCPGQRPSSVLCGSPAWARFCHSS